MGRQGSLQSLLFSHLPSLHPLRQRARSSLPRQMVMMRNDWGRIRSVGSRFYWSRSTKDPAYPHWFVVVVLPSQVFQICSRICTRAGQHGFKASSWSISEKKITSRESEMYSKTHRLPVPCAFYRLRVLILISLPLVTAGFVESTISVG